MIGSPMSPCFFGTLSAHTRWPGGLSTWKIYYSFLALHSRQVKICLLCCACLGWFVLQVCAGMGVNQTYHET